MPVPPPDALDTLAGRLHALRAAIAACAVAAGRPADSVRLVAVSKTRPAVAIAEAAAAGQLDFGENYVQELVDKQAALPDLRWHCIGSLQTNKVKYIAPFVYLIHALDSEKLLAEINKQAAKAGRVIPCLIQLNISEEDTKSGLDEAGAEALLQVLPRYPHVRIDGLMGMAAPDLTDEALRGQFRRLRLARDAFRRYDGPQVRMTELSMGMSDDYPAAIAEGATLVRVGSAIFGARE